MLNILIDIIIIIFDDPYYSRVYIQITSRFVSCLRCKKWKMAFLEKYRKKDRDKTGTHLRRNSKYIINKNPSTKFKE